MPSRMSRPIRHAVPDLIALRPVPPSPHHVRLRLLAPALALIAAATLVPADNPGMVVRPLCLTCGTLSTPDLLLNVLLFMPLGYVLGRAGRRPLAALGLGLLLSGSIEILQIVIPGRSPTLRDIGANAIGAALGALIAWRLSAWLAPGRRAVVLLGMATGGALAATALTGWSLGFDAPAGRYFGHAPPSHAHLAEWNGVVDTAEVLGLAVPSGEMLEADALRTRLRDTVTVRAVGTMGTPTPRLAGILRITAGTEDELLLLGARGDDLELTVRRRAATARLDAPAFTFVGALAGLQRGDPLRVAIDVTPRGGCATVNGTPRCVTRPAAGRTWTLARAFTGTPAWRARLLDTATVAFLLFPMGLLLGSVSRRLAVGAIALYAVGFPAAAWASGLAVPAVSEWTGVVIGFALAAWMARRLRARGP